MSDSYWLELACGHAVTRKVRGGRVPYDLRCSRCDSHQIVCRYRRLDEADNA